MRTLDGVSPGNEGFPQERPGSAMSGELVAAIVLVALAYLAAAWAGKLLAAPGHFASSLWPAAGLALAALLKGGMRCWPGIWLGASAGRV